MIAGVCLARTGKEEQREFDAIIASFLRQQEHLHVKAPTFGFRIEKEIPGSVFGEELEPVPAYPFIAIGLALGLRYLRLQVKPLEWRVPILVVLSVLVAGGLWNTVWFGFHLRPDLRNNDGIVQDEADIGLILAANPEPREVYALLYDFYETVEYYSGGRHMQAVTLGQPFDQSFYLITPTSLIKAHPFDSALEPHIEKLFEGPKLSLYRFTR